MKVLITLFLGFSFLFSSVDINNASASELTTLKGIREKKADAIIAYRQTHCFHNIDELQSVKGIGEKFIEKNRANPEVGSCTH